MIKSIQHFEEEIIPKFEELENKFLRAPWELDEYVETIIKELYEFGTYMVQETLETMDQLIQDSQI